MAGDCATAYPLTGVGPGDPRRTLEPGPFASIVPTKPGTRPTNPNGFSPLRDSPGTGSLVASRNLTGRHDLTLWEVGEYLLRTGRRIDREEL